MRGLTPAEQRGLLLIALLYGGGAAWDLWRARRPAPAPPRAAPRLSAASAMDGAPAAPAPPPPSAAPGAVQLNRASERELDALPGIGPVLARRITEHRRRHGPFLSVEELRAVRGIGPALLERLRPLVAVDSL